MPWLQSSGAFSLSKQRERFSAFTLAELVVSVGVLVLLVFLASHLVNSAASVTTLGHKQMDVDSQARQLLDRMAIDFAQMVKRSDVDYYVKSNPPLGLPPPRIVLQPGNDRIAFYSAVPGYYPTTSTGSQSPVSLVAYRVNSVSTNSAYTKTERLGKGLVWNAVSTTDTPVVFIPIPLASPLPATDLPAPPPNPLPPPAWPEASNATTSWSDYSEVIGPQVFRFEYYYLLKNGSFSGIPWISSLHSSVAGMQDVSAIVVNIAVIDRRSKALLGSTEAQINAQIVKFSTSGDARHFLVDYASLMTPGQLRTQWQNKLNGIINPTSADYDSSMPASAISGIRLYERVFYLSPPVL